MSLRVTEIAEYVVKEARELGMQTVALLLSYGSRHIWPDLPRPASNGVGNSPRSPA